MLNDLSMQGKANRLLISYRYYSTAFYGRSRSPDIELLIAKFKEIELLQQKNSYELCLIHNCLLNSQLSFHSDLQYVSATDSRSLKLQ